jgi:hypothetical protein
MTKAASFARASLLGGGMTLVACASHAPIATSVPRAAPHVGSSRPSTPSRQSGTSTGSPEKLAAISPEAPHEFPTRITTQDPRLARDLDPTAPLPRYSSAPKPSARFLEMAQRFVNAIERPLRDGRLRLEIRTGCSIEANGDALVEGRALVRDSNNHVRAFTESVGTSDSAAVWKLYYDDSVLRLASFVWSNYAGQNTAGFMVFDESGRLVSCFASPRGTGTQFCGPEADPTDSLDPEVRNVTTPTPTRMSEAASWAAHLDPVAELFECNTPYNPTPERRPTSR